jgi:hypothetical protein
LAATRVFATSGWDLRLRFQVIPATYRPGQSAAYLKRVTAIDPRKTLTYYRGLNFNEMLMAYPIDDADLTRELQYPRAVEP